jgi:predicted ATPase
MRFTALRLQNWRNFRRVDVELRDRVFIVGANASGKSNLLDAFRFLREVAEDGGGLQRAVETTRHGLKYVRSLHARDKTDVVVDVQAGDDKRPDQWRYELTLQGGKGKRPVVVKKERVWQQGNLILDRPSKEDTADPDELSQTHLEQVSKNRKFRELAKFLSSVEYAHVVPQLVRDARPTAERRSASDPFGSDLLEEIARTPTREQTKRLARINAALQAVLPQFKELKLERDKVGRPHLTTNYAHWRAPGSLQREDQFSDGTLRLIGLLWALTRSDAVLLLEEPELSLHSAAVRQLPQLVAKVNAARKRQVILSTHSQELLDDPGIDPSEVLELLSTNEDTQVQEGSKDPALVAKARGGGTLGAELVAKVQPRDVLQLSLSFPEVSSR